MKQQLKAEAQVLERVLYLLEETSVMHLMQEDEHFASYIADLYSAIQNQQANLSQA